MTLFCAELYGFDDDNITVLMDDGIHQTPTRENMVCAPQELDPIHEE